MIVLDAAAIPDGPSGARTRLRGLVAAYARLPDAPPLVVRIATGATLLDGVDLGGAGVSVEFAPRPGGPLRRALTPRLRRAPDGPLARAAKLWHSETIPPLQPRGVPALLTIHDLRWSEPRAVTGAPWPKWALRHLAARVWLPGLARAIAGVVTVSESSARAIVERLRVPRERVHVIPNANVGLASPRLGAAAEVELLVRLGLGDPARPFFLAIGHLEPRKGLDLVFAALAHAAARPDSALARTQLVLVGRGAGEAELRAQAQRLGLGGRVVFAGALDDAATASLYARAAALLFPSRYEGFGFPVHEAREHGCPVIARRIAALAEAFESADPDVMLLGDDTREWSDALERRIASHRAPADRAAAARAARRPARVASWGDAALRLASLYRSLLR